MPRTNERPPATTRGLSQAAKAEAIENAIYDLKAVNPNRKAEVDTRTQTELLDVIEGKRVEVAQALPALRALVEAGGDHLRWTRCLARLPVHCPASSDSAEEREEIPDDRDREIRLVLVDRHSCEEEHPTTEQNDRDEERQAPPTQLVPVPNGLLLRVLHRGLREVRRDLGEEVKQLLEVLVFGIRVPSWQRRAQRSSLRRSGPSLRLRTCSPV